MELELVFIDNMVKIEALKGRWLPFNPEVEINDVFKCSICSEYVQLVWKTKKCPYKFCPYCGIEMG